MPRPRLSSVPTKVLHAELERRVSKLASLLKLRDDVDRQVAKLKALAGQFVGATTAPGNVKKGPRPEAVARKAPAAKRRGKRVQYAQTANDFVLGLLAGGKVLTSAELGQEWANAGRKGKVDNVLTLLVKAKKLKRRKIRGKKGSKYRLA